MPWPWLAPCLSLSLSVPYLAESEGCEEEAVTEGGDSRALSVAAATAAEAEWRCCQRGCWRRGGMLLGEWEDNAMA